MTLPSVDITKVDYQTGSVGPSNIGILAIIAAAGAGAFNAPSAYTGDAQVATDYGGGKLTEDCSYTLAQSGQPVVPIRATTATAAAYGAITVTGTGTSVITAGAAVPVDDYSVVVNWKTGGTIGVTGITWTYSLDGGVTTSGVQSLGTANTLTIPAFSLGGSPGVSFALAAGTIVAGDSFTCPVTAAVVTDTDLPASLEALRVYSGPWEAVYLDMPAVAGTSGIVDTWLRSLEAVGKFRHAWINTPMKGSASESSFATTCGTLVAGSAPSIRLLFCADGGDVGSTLTGLTLPRQTALCAAADAMGIPIGQDPAWVGAGPVGGVSIVNAKSGPKYHNEALYPNLDQLLLTTFRNISGKSANAVYITNANVFSTVGSDYVFAPHIRTMNQACEVAWGVLQEQLGKGVGKKPKATTGQVYILESDAASIENLVNAALATPLKGQVNAYKFTLSRNDDISANSGATVTGTLQIVAKAYIKKVKVIAGFAKDISVSL